MCHVAELCVYATLRKGTELLLCSLQFSLAINLCRNVTYNLKHCKPICSL